MSYKRSPRYQERVHRRLRAMQGGKARARMARELVPRTKNGDSRDVPLSKRAREILAALPRGDDPCFALHPGTRDALWRRAVKAARIEDLHFHDTRSEAIWRLSRVFGIMDLARITGHRNYNSLQLYYNATADDLADRV